MILTNTMHSLIRHQRSFCFFFSFFIYIKVDWISMIHPVISSAVTETHTNTHIVNNSNKRATTSKQEPIWYNRKSQKKKEKMKCTNETFSAPINSSVAFYRFVSFCKTLCSFGCSSKRENLTFIIMKIISILLCAQ